MDDEQKKQTIHMLPKGKATTKFREQHKKATKTLPAANANRVSVSIEQQLNAVLAVRLRKISNPKLRKAIEECVREEALKKLAKTMPGEVVRAVDTSIAEINKSLGAVVPGRPASPPSPSSYGGKYSPSSGGKASPSSGGKSSPGSGGKSSPPPARPPVRSRGNGGKSSTRYGGK